ncbi:MAG: response regulator [Candidatus Omnitrophota bacterium]|nr:response regulator [Candidatus Omnitrophota bacterium]
MPENLMDIQQLAEYLQMNKMTVYKLARQGKIPAFKVASEWRFRRDLIDVWVMRQIKDKTDITGLESKVKSLSRKTVLVVDDEEIIRDFFTRTLSEYRVLAATNGKEALEMIKKEKPDLVLLDIKMPGIDGIETLRRIKEIDRSIAVIMLSAFGTLETSLEAARLGAYTSIAKPFDLNEMRIVLNNALLGEPESELSKSPVKKSQKKRGKER